MDSASRWRWRLRLPPSRVCRTALAAFEIYLVLSLNLVGVFAEGLPGGKFIRRNGEREEEEQQKVRISFNSSANTRE